MITLRSNIQVIVRLEEKNKEKSWEENNLKRTLPLTSKFSQDYNYESSDGDGPLRTKCNEWI